MNAFEPNCLFRVEAGPGVGLGHLSRCLALALWLRQAGAESGFVMSRPGPEVRSRVEEPGFVVLERPGFPKPGSSQDASDLSELAEESGAAWLIVDGYKFGPEYFHILRRSTRAAILAVDDFQGRLEADLILNQNLAVDGEIYGGSRAGLLIGPDYCLLPPGLEGQKPRDYQAGVRRILVTTGGGDPGGLTPKVVAALSRLHGLEVDVVAGPFAKDGFEAASNTTSFKFHQDLPSLLPLIRGADLAVMGLGVTTWEMAASGLPFVMMPHHPAQVPTAGWLEEKGCATLGLESGEFDEGRFLKAVQGLLDDPATLARQSRALIKLVDGRGGARAAAAMDGIRSIGP